MKILDLLRHNGKALPPAAGGAPQPGEQLAAGVPYMSEQTGRDVTEWVQAWREMPDEQYKALARDL
jgi:hypothetical protein